MKKWTILAALFLGCIPKGGTSSKPDDGELSTFEQFSMWGQGMAGFTAPSSNQVAGGGGSGGGGTGGEDTGGWDDTGGWTDGDVDGGADDGGADASCSWGEDACVEANEPDNEAWCYDNGGTPSSYGCSDGYAGICYLSPGSYYSAPATMYYYGSDASEWAESACEEAGGEYSGGSGAALRTTGSIEVPATLVTDTVGGVK
jgi:hypothetical protein